MKSKRIILFLSFLYVLVGSCHHENTSKFHHSKEICDGLYVETFTVFGMGAGGGSLFGDCLTDSTSFRVFVGSYDEGHEGIDYKCIGENLRVKFYSDLTKFGKYSKDSNEVYSLNALTQLNNYSNGKVTYFKDLDTLSSVGMSLVSKSIKLPGPNQGENRPLINYNSTHSVKGILKALSPKSQSFTINPNEDSFLKGEKGTVIYVPAKSFKLEDGTYPKGQVQLEMKEYYTLTDMIAESLNTTSEKRILETGGMLYFNATSGGKKVIITDGKALAIGFPKGNQLNEMNLFYGIGSESSSPEWVPDYMMYNVEEIWNYSNDSSNPHPQFGITDDLFDYGFSVCYFNADLQLLKLKKENTSFFDYIENAPGLDDSELRKYVNNEYRVHCSINFSENGKIVGVKILERDLEELTFYDHFSTTLVKKLLGNVPPLELNQESLRIDQKKAYPIGICGFKKLNQERFKEKIRSQFFGYKEIAAKYLDREALNYFVFAATRMGWINCDRFWDTNEERTDFIVKCPNAIDTKVHLVFDDINSILTGTYKNGNLVFKNVPLGKDIKIIGIKYFDGKPTMSVAETTTDLNGYELTEFKPFTLGELEKELNSMKNY